MNDILDFTNYNAISNFKQRLKIIQNISNNFDKELFLKKNNLTDSLIRVTEEGSRFNLVLNTSNKNKISELRDFFKYNEIGIMLSDIFHLSPSGFSNVPCEESSDTFLGNAKLKSDALADMYNSHIGNNTKEKNFLIMSDDSGFITWQLPKILGVRSKRFATDNMDFVRYYLPNEYAQLSKGIYSYSLNNIVLSEYFKVVMKEKNILLEDVNRDCTLVTGINLSVYGIKNKTVECKNSINSVGTLDGILRIEEMLNYRETKINECRFGFNSLVQLKRNNTLYNYSDIPTEDIIKINHRQYAFADSLLSFLELHYL